MGRSKRAGCTNKTTARELGVSEPTIKFHLRNLCRKLGVGNRRAAIGEARPRGWLDETSASLAET